MITGTYQVLQWRWISDLAPSTNKPAAGFSFISNKQVTERKMYEFSPHDVCWSVCRLSVDETRTQKK